MNKFEIEAYDVLRTRRAAAETLALENLAKARTDADFLKNEIAIRTVELDIAKAKDGGEKQKLQNNLKALEKGRKQILEKIGFREKDLQPQPYCTICGDSGTINGKRCKCFRNIVLYKILKESGVEAKDLVSFDEFRTDIAQDALQQKELAAYKKFLQGIAEKFPNQGVKTITVCGTTGAGKTFGAKCLLREILKMGEPACFLTAFEINSLFLKYHTAFVEDKNAVFEAMLSPELLIVDDLGTEPVLKNVTKEYLYVLVTERQELGKTTLITTNLGPDHILDRYGERVFSRLTDKSKSNLIKLEGKDLRHK